MHASPLAPRALFFGLLLSTAASGQGWVPGPAFPGAPSPRADAAAISHGGKLYVMGGTPLVAPKFEESPVEELTLGASAYVNLTDLEGPMKRVGVGEDSLGRLIVFGGVDAGDPEGDVGKSYWYHLVDGKKGNTGQRSSAAGEDFFAFATDDAHRIYAMGGVPQNGSVTTSNVERYDGAADTWTVMASMPTAVGAGAAVNDGQGHLVVIGGWTSGGTYTANVARYDVASNTWSDTAIPDLPIATAHLAAATGADGRIYAIGGRTSLGYAKDVWVLDASHTAWTAGPQLPTVRGYFSAALGADNNIYALGGLDGLGSAIGTEILYTPNCPEFPGSVAATHQVWQSLPAVIGVDVFGGGTLAMRWKKDGVDVFDGPSVGGGLLSGADTDTLRIDGWGAADQGVYELVATNGCGTATSPAQALELREVPNLAGLWSVESIHPAGALGSAAYGIDSGEVVGSGTYPDAKYGSLSHPLLWTYPGSGHLDLTPPASVGGGLAVSVAGTQAGWYWWPYTTPQGTGYHKHAAVWSGSAGTHIDIQPTGWEYGSINDSDGTHHVGNVTPNDFSTHGIGAYWASSQKSAINLTPSGDWGSSANAIHDGHQYGSVIHPFATVHAAKWSGSAASYVDMNPAGSNWSYVLGADDGAQVGRATFAGVHHAVMWGGSAEVFADLHPVGASQSTAREVRGGLVLGSIDNQSVLWFGGADDHVSLSTHLSSDYSYGTGNDFVVLPDGDVLVAGTGYNTVTQRSEALVWRMRAATLGADVTELSLATGGTQNLSFDLGPDFAGQLHLVLGSATGTSPGFQVDGVTLPLAFDSYFLLSLSQPAGLFQGTFGFLDAQGTASASLNLPPGADPGLAGLVLHHAGLVIDLLGTGSASWATNAVVIELVP